MHALLLRLPKTDSKVSNFVSLVFFASVIMLICYRQAQDIGSWYQIYEFIGLAAAVVNSALITFTSHAAANYNNETRAWIFLGMTTLLILIKVIFKSIIPDVPLEVKIQLRRQKFIVSKIFEDHADKKSWEGLTEEEEWQSRKVFLDNCIEPVGTNDMVPF